MPLRMGPELLLPGTVRSFLGSFRGPSSTQSVSHVTFAPSRSRRAASAYWLVCRSGARADQFGHIPPHGPSRLPDWECGLLTGRGPVERTVWCLGRRRPQRSALRSPSWASQLARWSRSLGGTRTPTTPRFGIEDLTGTELEDELYADGADAVLIWFRDGDDDLVDTLVDAAHLPGRGGLPRPVHATIGPDRHVEASDVEDAALSAGPAHRGQRRRVTALGGHADRGPQVPTQVSAGLVTGPVSPSFGRLSVMTTPDVGEPAPTSRCPTSTGSRRRSPTCAGRWSRSSSTRLPSPARAPASCAKSATASRTFSMTASRCSPSRATRCTHCGPGPTPRATSSRSCRTSGRTVRCLVPTGCSAGQGLRHPSDLPARRRRRRALGPCQPAGPGPRLHAVPRRTGPVTLRPHPPGL